MKRKLIWSSVGFLIVSLISRNLTLFSNQPRKCSPYRQVSIGITFSNREECIRSVEQSQTNPDNKNYLSTLQEIEMRGYNVSSYTILSKDGYYSTIYRISGGWSSPPKPGKSSVLLFHGGGAAAESWIIQPGSRNFAFTLADAGYEVWLPNARGSTPSTNHTHLNAETDIEYWEFSHEEMALHDLPLYIDLMLEETGSEKVYYSCQSMGCGVYLMGLSEVPELNKKIKAGFLLAPPGLAGSSYNLAITIPSIIVGTPFENLVFRLLGGRFSNSPSFLATTLGLTLENFCKWSSIRCGICDNFLFAMYGANPQQLNHSDFTNIMQKLQNNVVLRTLFHGMQNYKTCDFRRYDHGPEKNLLKYGSEQPPQFNLSRIAAPTYIFYGESDNIITPVDAERTRDAIPAEYMKGFYKVEWPLFNHIDFLMAKDADVLVYHKVRDIINELELQQNLLKPKGVVKHE